MSIFKTLRHENDLDTSKIILCNFINIYNFQYKYPINYKKRNNINSIKNK